MFQALFDYFYNLFNGLTFDSGDSINDIFLSLGNEGGVANLNLADYLAFISSLISLIIIVVLCCLFIGKIIKTIGRLFSGGTL